MPPATTAQGVNLKLEFAPAFKHYFFLFCETRIVGTACRFRQLAIIIAVGQRGQTT